MMKTWLTLQAITFELASLYLLGQLFRVVLAGFA